MRRYEIGIPGYSSGNIGLDKRPKQRLVLYEFRVLEYFQGDVKIKNAFHHKCVLCPILD